MEDRFTYKKKNGDEYKCPIKATPKINMPTYKDNETAGRWVNAGEVITIVEIGKSDYGEDYGKLDTGEWILIKDEAIEIIAAGSDSISSIGQEEIERRAKTIAANESKRIQDEQRKFKRYVYRRRIAGPLVLFVVVLVIVSLVLIFEKAETKRVEEAVMQNSNNNTDDNTVKCPVCGRTFKKGTSNAKSIRRTNMCENCYKNYKYAEELMGN